MSTSKRNKKKSKRDHAWFWYFIVARVACRVVTMGHDVHVYNEATRHIKPPFIAVGNHQGQWDFFYAYKALLPHKVRIVATRYQFFRPLAGILMRKTGAIGKSQFASDPSAVREILRTIKRDGSILIYPSGRISLFGEDAKPFRGGYELLKKLNVPVIMVHLDGSYRTGPRYNPDIKKRGRVDVRTSVLFTPEDFQSLPEDEALRRFDAAFCHDDFDSPNQGEYRSKNLIAGLEDLLYMCPECRSDFSMQTEGKTIIRCTKCGFIATMDRRFRFKSVDGAACPATISEWGRLIRAEELKRATENPEYTIRAEMKLCEHIKTFEMMSQVGTVQAVYDAKGFHLKGDRHGKPFERFYSCEEYPAIHFLDKINIIVPDSETVTCVRPPSAAEVTKWAVVSEAFSTKSADTKNMSRAI